MTKEELIGKLQMVYVGDKNALNELIGYYDGLKEVVELLKKENQKYKEVIDKATNDLNIIIDIVREQPLGSDCWIIDRLEANKSILKEVE